MSKITNRNCCLTVIVKLSELINSVQKVLFQLVIFHG